MGPRRAHRGRARPRRPQRTERRDERRAPELTARPAGPLAGVRVLEFAGLGPVPFAGMMLADHGADVVRIDRAAAAGASASQVLEAAIGLPGLDELPLHRGRRSLAVDLTAPAGVDLVLRLVERADVLLEGYRPGVLERRGLGPEPCLARNPALVYARLTGFGQDGPWAHLAGHDIDYLAASGVLHGLGGAGPTPVPPQNLLADFGGGGMLAAFGIAAALAQVRGGGAGQVVDISMTEGAALLGVNAYGPPVGTLPTGRGEGMLDGACPFYNCYATADGGFYAVGAVEEPFYRELVAVLGVEPEPFEVRLDPSRWPATLARFREIFAGRTRAEWDEAFTGRDACAFPVLRPDEAPLAAHHVHRDAFPADARGRPQPAPAPRFSAGAGTLPAPGSIPGADTLAVLAEFGVSAPEAAALLEAGTVSAGRYPNSSSR